MLDTNAVSAKDSSELVQEIHAHAGSFSAKPTTRNKVVAAAVHTEAATLSDPAVAQLPRFSSGSLRLHLGQLRIPRAVFMPSALGLGVPLPLFGGIAPPPESWKLKVHHPKLRHDGSPGLLHAHRQRLPGPHLPEVGGRRRAHLCGSAPGAGAPGPCGSGGVGPAGPQPGASALSLDPLKAFSGRMRAGPAPRRPGRDPWSPSGGIAPAPSGTIVAVSALESAMAHSTPSPPADPMPQQDGSQHAWDVFSQLQRTRQWEADGLQLRRPVNVQKKLSAEAAPP